MNIAASIVVVLIMLGVLATLHELGHYWMARLLKIKVFEVSIFVGPKLLKWKHMGVDFSLRMIPIGAYVRFSEVDEEGKAVDSKDPDLLLNQPRIKRLLVALAGPAMNLCLGILIFLVMFWVTGFTTTHITKPEKGSQLAAYAEMVNAKFFGLVNGIDIYFFHKNYDGIYCEIEGIPTFEEMKKDVYIEMSECPVFQRLNYNEYFDLNFLESQDWFSYKIGDDTDGDLIPCIIALDDCLLDFSQQLTKIESSRFEIIEDLGIQFRQYGDASDSDFGSGEYRVFMMNDKLLHQQFLVGFTISATGKTFNDPKYGNSSGKSVLVLMYNNGSVDETPAQINLNQFLKVDNEKKIMKIIHNGATHRKGAKKQDLLEYVKQFNENLVKNNQIEFGSVDFSKPLYFKNEDVKYLFTNLIEYCVYREEYKICLSNKK